MLNPSFCLPSEIADLLTQTCHHLGQGHRRLVRTTDGRNFIRNHTRIRRHFTGAIAALQACGFGSFLDRSHELSQNIETPEGSWWRHRAPSRTRCGKQLLVSPCGRPFIVFHTWRKVRNMPNKLSFRMKLNGYLNVPTGNHNNLLRHVNLHATIPTKLFAVFSEK